MSSTIGTMSAKNSWPTSPRGNTCQANSGNDLQIATIHAALASAVKKKVKLEAESVNHSIYPPSEPQVSLVTEPVGRDDQKPPYSYSQLIIQAISSAPDKQLTLNEIYSYITKHYPFYTDRDRGWQNCVRHNLSFSPNFVNVPRSREEAGKGGFWKVDSLSESKLTERAYHCKRRRLSLPSRSAPVSPSHSSVSGSITSDSSSHKPSPVSSDNTANSASGSVSQASPAAITQPCYVRLTRDIEAIHTAQESPNKSSGKHRKNLKRKALEMEAMSSLSLQSSSNIPSYSYDHYLEVPKYCENRSSVPQHCPDKTSILGSLFQTGRTTKRVTHESQNRSSNKNNSLQKEEKPMELIIVDVCSINANQFANIQPSNPDSFQNSSFKTVATHISLPEDPFHWNVDNKNIGLCLPPEADCFSVSQEQSERRFLGTIETDSQPLSEDKWITPSHEIVLHPEFSDVDISRKLSPPGPSCSSNAFLTGVSSVAEELYEINIKKNAEEENNQPSNQDKLPSQGIEISKCSSMFSNSSSMCKCDIDDSDYCQHLSTLDYCYFASTYSQLKAFSKGSSKFSNSSFSCKNEIDDSDYYQHLSTLDYCYFPSTYSQLKAFSKGFGVFLNPSSTGKDDSDDSDYYQHLSTLDYCHFASTYSQLKASLVEKIKGQENLNNHSSTTEILATSNCILETEKNKLSESYQKSDCSALPENNLNHIGKRCFTPSPAAILEKNTGPYRSETSETFKNSINRSPFNHLPDTLENIFKSNDKNSAVPCSKKNFQDYSKGANRVYSSNEFPTMSPDAASSSSFHESSFNHKFINQDSFLGRIKYFKDLLFEAKFNFDRKCTNILKQMENFLAETISLKSPEMEDLSFIDPIYERYLSNRDKTERDFVKSLLFSSNQPKSFNASKDCYQFEKSLRDKWQRFNEYQNNVSNCDLKPFNTDCLNTTSPNYSAVINECVTETTSCKSPHVTPENGETFRKTLKSILKYKKN